MLLVYLCAKNSHPMRGTASLCILRLERRPDHAEGKGVRSEFSTHVRSQMLLPSAGRRDTGFSSLSATCVTLQVLIFLHLLFPGGHAHDILHRWRPEWVTNYVFISQWPSPSPPLSLTVSWWPSSDFLIGKTSRTQCPNCLPKCARDLNAASPWECRVQRSLISWGVEERKCLHKLIGASALCWRACFRPPQWCAQGSSSRAVGPLDQHTPCWHIYCFMLIILLETE